MVSINAASGGNLALVDLLLIGTYGFAVIGIGWFFAWRMKTARQFITAGGSIPGWAAGLAVMSAYTSSISYIATPGKAYDADWHPLLFALCMIPVVWLVVLRIIPLYRNLQLVSVYAFLESRLGSWARVYGALSFLLYMISRMAVILYLVALLIQPFIGGNIVWAILLIGLLTILYTQLGGVEAVIWTDVLQAAVMLGGMVLTIFLLVQKVYLPDVGLLHKAWDAGKFSLGSTEYSLGERTIWVMLLYGLSENLRNLIADQNYVQKYNAVSDTHAAAGSLRLATAIYVALTFGFLFIGTSLYLFYLPEGSLPTSVVKGDQVFPHFIGTQLPIGVKGLILAAIVAAAMSTVDSALNCSATVIWVDFLGGWFPEGSGESGKLQILRAATWVIGLLGTGFALWMVRARSALDLWWQLSGIFGGAVLGLFLLALLRVQLSRWQGLACLLAGVGTIFWVTFARNAQEPLGIWHCTLDPILAGVVGTMTILGTGIATHVICRGLALRGNPR